MIHKRSGETVSSAEQAHGENSHLVTACWEDIRDGLSALSIACAAAAAGWPSSRETIGLGVGVTACLLIDAIPVTLRVSNNDNGRKYCERLLHLEGLMVGLK